MMMTKRAIYSSIGLDMTSDRIRLLQLKWHKGLLSIHAASHANFSKAEITGGQDEKGLPDFCTALRRLLSTGKFKGNQVMVALPDHLVTTIPIKFTLKEGEGIDQAILREANNYLPFPQEQGGTVSSYFVIDYLDLPSSDQRSQLSDQRSQQTKAQPMAALLIAARTEDVLRYLNLLKNAGLEAAVIEPRYCSLFRTIQWAQQGKPLKDQFIFSMGENDTLLMVIVDDRILIVRGLAWGINTIKEKLEKALGLSGTVADLVLHHYGVDDLWRSRQRSDNPDKEKSGVFLSEGNLCQVIYEVLSPVLEDFCQEIQKVLSYCVSMVQQRVIDRALLLGEGARIKSLDHFIQQRTGIRITAWPPTAIEETGRRGEGETGRGGGVENPYQSSKDQSSSGDQDKSATDHRGTRSPFYNRSSGESERPIEDGFSMIKELAGDYPFFEVALGLALRGTKAGIRDKEAGRLGNRETSPPLPFSSSPPLTTTTGSTRGADREAPSTDDYRSAGDHRRRFEET